VAKPDILVLDDDPIVISYLTKNLSKKYKIHSFQNGKDAVSFLKGNPIDLALLDIDLGIGIDGIETLKEMTNIDSNLSVIMISSVTDVETIVSSMHGGALDFHEKPIDITKLNYQISRTFEINDMKTISARYKHLKEKEYSENMIVGSDPKILKCKQLIENAGPMRLLILGETGVGKTPFARYSNFVLSKETKKVRAFEQINCASLKRDRFIDELFGHVKGAYTGAISDKKGLVELAEGGDLFLDEIGDLDLECQAELLTFLDNYEYYKLGGTQKKVSQIRIICATNCDLKQMIADGTFRKDLYSRIAQCVVQIPPLRERKGDIETFVKHFTKNYLSSEKKICPSLFEHLVKFDWDEGNVRDLENVCEYMCISSRKFDQIEISHLPDSYAKVDASSIQNKTLDNFNPNEVFELGYDTYLEQIEYSICKSLLENEKKVAILADKISLNRMTLNRKLVKLNLK
jgi:DNA-binding NtrC family response regulator